MLNKFKYSFLNLLYSVSVIFHLVLYLTTQTVDFLLLLIYFFLV